MKNKKEKFKDKNIPAIENLPELDNSPKQFSGNINALIALYNSVQADITNYRNWEWKITVYYAFLSTGVLSFATSEGIKIYLNEGMTFLKFGLLKI